MTASLHRDTPALVIGGTRGLGLAIAERLMAEGCTRLIIAGRDSARGEAAAEASGATCLPVDPEDTAAVVRLVDEAAERILGSGSGVMTGSVVDFDQHVPGSCPE